MLLVDRGADVAVGTVTVVLTVAAVTALTTVVVQMLRARRRRRESLFQEEFDGGNTFDTVHFRTQIAKRVRGRRRRGGSS